MTERHESPTAGAAPAMGEESQLPLTYSVVVQYYGEIMARLGRLEANLAQLKERVDRLDASAAPEASLVEKVLERVSALEQSLTNGATHKAEPDERDRLLEQLRLQVSSLSAKLAETQERLQNAGLRHRRRRSRRPWWRFWGRRHY